MAARLDQSPVKMWQPRVITSPLPMHVEEGYEDSPEGKFEYEQDTVALVQSLLDESKEAYAEKKLKWKRADKLAELDHILNGVMGDPATTRLPLLAPAIEEYLSNRMDEQLVPACSSRQQAMDPLCNFLNYVKDQELDANRYTLLKLRKRLDQLRYRIHFTYVGVDPSEPSIFGHMGRHKLDRVDPRYVWPDAFAETWDFTRMRYVIIARPMDLAEIVQRWPDKGHLVKADRRLSVGTTNNDLEPASQVGSNVIHAGKNVAGFDVGKRDRAIVLECYLQDTRTRAVASRTDSDGAPKLNSEGKPMTKMEKRYPHGRLMVVSNGVLLRDSKNPWKHGKPPIVAYPDGIYDGMFSYSPLEVLDIVDRKINMLFKEQMGNLMVNMNSPILVGRKAFSKPSQYEDFQVAPGQVMTVNENSFVKRMEPGVLPPEVGAVIGTLTDIFDSILGINDVSRGNLEKGAEVSSQTVQDLQAAAMKRSQLHTSLDKESTEQMGHLLFYNIMQFYPPVMNITVKDPDSGKDVPYVWNKDDWDDGWTLKVDVQSNSPGAKQSADQQAITLFDKGIVDQQYVLQQLKIPLEVKQRMDEQREKLASLGLVNEAWNLGKHNSAGRKSQQPLV